MTSLPRDLLQFVPPPPHDGEVRDGAGLRGVPVAALLRQSKDELVDAWERAVRDEPSPFHAMRAKEPALRADIDALVDRIVAALDGGPGANDWRAACRDGGSVDHARERIQAGYTLESALGELSRFRDVLADLLYALAVVPTRQELRIISDAIDETTVIVAARMRDAEHARVAAVQERFVAILGHDLRNPLNAITISADALLHRRLPEREAACAARIARAAGRMARMIGDIYDFASARLGRSGLKLATDRSSIVELCTEAIDELRLVHDARCIVFEPREDARGTWDRGRILRVLSNLLGNALAYSPPDTDVHIGVVAKESRVVVTIHNEGEPIDPAKISTIFEPFARADSAFRKSDGLGLGLFIAREITRAHGGDIRVESSQERGTSLTVELPLDVPAAG